MAKSLFLHTTHIGAGAGEQVPGAGEQVPDNSYMRNARLLLGD
jgi:hypothetical protein